MSMLLPAGTKSMHYIYCPCCHENFDETEFSCGGELRKKIDPSICTDKEWNEYLYMRQNTKGVLQELWMHSKGCLLWFIAERDTRTHEILNTSPLARRSQQA